MVRLIRGQMERGISGWSRDEVGGIDDALEGAEQKVFRILVPHYAATGKAFSRRTWRGLDIKCAASIEYKAHARDIGEQGAGGQRLASAVPPPPPAFTVFEVEMSNWVRSEGLMQANRVVGTTKSQLRALILRGQDEGFGSLKIAREIRTRAPNLSKLRGVAIARTETHNAATFAGQEAARATGLDLRKFWLSNPPGRTRDDHVAANGQGRKLDEAYTVGFSELMRPGDSSLGAAAEQVIQCRCGEIYEPLAA